MISGAHVVIYSQDAEADRAFFAKVMKLDHVDVGQGWLIFKLPPSELAIHPSNENDLYQLYLMCEDLDRTIRLLSTNGVPCGPPASQGWGRSTNFQLPGGGKVGLYEPRHMRP